MSREYPGNRSADARDAGCRRDRTSRRHRLQRPGNILSRPAGKGVGVRPSDNNGYDETRERSGSPKSGETKEKQKQLYRQSHRSRKWRCRCLSVARPDCGNGRLNEKESAAHPGRGKSRNLFGKYDDPTARPTTSFESGNPMRKGCANKNKDDYILYYQAFETSDPTRLFAACAMHENKKAGF